MFTLVSRGKGGRGQGKWWGAGRPGRRKPGKARQGFLLCGYKDEGQFQRTPTQITTSPYVLFPQPLQESISTAHPPQGSLLHVPKTRLPPPFTHRSHPSPACLSSTRSSLAPLRAFLPNHPSLTYSSLCSNKEQFDYVLI